MQARHELVKYNTCLSTSYVFLQSVVADRLQKAAEGGEA